MALAQGLCLASGIAEVCLDLRKIILHASQRSGCNLQTEQSQEGFSALGFSRWRCPPSAEDGGG